MRTKNFLALLIVAAVSVAAAGYAVVSRSLSDRTPVAASTPVFPDLLVQANDVAEIAIASAKGKVTMRRQGDRWELIEKDSYPVAVDKLSKLVAGLASLRLLEPKTDRPERYARLEVEDVTAKDAKSRLVTLRGADGKTLASLIVGKKSYTGMTDAGGLYVRRPDEARSWLAEGSLEVPDSALGWMERTVLDLARESVQRLAFRPAGGEPLTASKADRDAEELTLAPLPEGESPDQEAVDKLASAFAGITFDDVRKDALGADAAAKATAEAVTFDGLTARVALFDLDGATWARLSAAGAAGGEAEEQAKTINDRVSGWLYKLPAYKASALQPKLDDLLKKDDGTS